MTDLNWYGNTSGRGTLEGLPPDIKDKWNWGAFLLAPFWAFSNKKFLLGFLSIVPIVWLVIAIMLGYKGNEWAWENVEWKDVNNFQRAQKTWARVGAIIWLVLFTLRLLTIILKH